MTSVKERAKGGAEDSSGERASRRSRLIRLLSGFGVVKYGLPPFVPHLNRPSASASVYAAGDPFTPESRLWTVAVSAETTASAAARRAELQTTLLDQASKRSDLTPASRDQETTFWSEGDLVWLRIDDAASRRRIQAQK